METADGQSVLRCEQCNKPFDKHMDTTVGLEESVVPLDLDHVSLVPKGKLVVIISDPNARGVYPRPLDVTIHMPRPEAHTERRRIGSSLVEAVPSIDTPQDSRNGDMTSQNALVTLEPNFANAGEQLLDWDYTNIDFAEFLNSPTNEENVQYPSFRSSSLLRQSTPPPSTAQIFHEHRFHEHRFHEHRFHEHQFSSSNISIPPVPDPFFRSLVLKPTVGFGASRIATLILHNLRSYPLMMLRHDALPPFIHPALISSNEEDNYMEPLTNCISLVHMISSRVQGSRKLFWKNVRVECERLCADHMKLTRWELLAAMQALSIYILIRLEETETDYNNFDVLLVTTVTVIAKRITCSLKTCNTPSALCSYNRDITWKDWIYEESRRRLSVVYRVVGMLVHFDPAGMCALQKDLVLAPLPAKKQLWEASDEFTWRAERERDPRSKSDFGLAANGELVELDEGQMYCSDAVLLYKSLDARVPERRGAMWEDWCSGMDGFGGLVMLAASLIV
ncbi:uncharacterized protein LY89DRAFT_670467 [Mollisia scopiformis]|uniref:Transcription factor domain-containing protein n=1 Tax=Mollisia scopiformis TaxID=149040 RepID=A0A194X6Y8_MOLSC|nr:uncharacterized protein LY89DRAFT_670467 [Mollisia scopiformis]KUJ15935.1 hypothetical protein LY89DRAFT_670467 [Mollisia scopiformis]